MENLFLRVFRKLFRKNHFHSQSSGKEYAFCVAGKDYYQLADFNNLPPRRAMKTLVFYEELRMKCTVDYLQLHTKAMDAILSSNKIDVFEIKKLNDQMKQRLDIAVDMEGVYKIASIVYFDEGEDISDYDFAYNAKKIARWKKYHADDFFLLQPIRRLVPVLEGIDENFKKYTHLVAAMNEIHSDVLLQHLPSEKKKKSKTPSSSFAGKTTQLN